MRIGSGFDAHSFVSGRKLILGGVEIPYEYGIGAHSDGDVLLHALCDALLGAVALGDIGQHFPDTGKEFKNIDSRVLLRHVVRLVHAQKWVVGNIDTTLIAQAPKLAPYREAMRKNIAEDLQVDIEQVSVKATTTDRMGFTGRKEGIAVQATVLLFPEYGT